MLQKSLCVTPNLQHPEILEAAFMCDNCDALSNDIGSFKLETCSMNLAHLSGDPVDPASVNAASVPVPPTALQASAVPEEPREPPPKLRRTKPEATLDEARLELQEGELLNRLDSSMAPRISKAIEAAQKELHQLRTLQALTEERIKLENLLVERAKQESLMTTTPSIPADNASSTCADFFPPVGPTHLYPRS